ncbi:MAG: hypothetical protein V8R80_12675 [Eubacterium sp.]
MVNEKIYEQVKQQVIKDARVMREINRAVPTSGERNRSPGTGQTD